MRKHFFRENMGMVASSGEFLMLFGALIFLGTMAARFALDAVTALETAVGKVL